MEIKRISPEQAKELLDADQDYVYLDVRTVPEFDAGHVPGAKNIPVMEPDVQGRMQVNPRFVEIVEAKFGKEVKCITGCQKGMRSLRAAELLVGAGFSHVLDMRGGFLGEIDPQGRVVFAGWTLSGFPSTRDCSPEDRYDSLCK